MSLQAKEDKEREKAAKKNDKKLAKEEKKKAKAKEKEGKKGEKGREWRVASMGSGRISAAMSVAGGEADDDDADEQGAAAAAAAGGSVGLSGPASAADRERSPEVRWFRPPATVPCDVTNRTAGKKRAFLAGRGGKAVGRRDAGLGVRRQLAAATLPDGRRPRVASVFFFCSLHGGRLQNYGRFDDFWPPATGEQCARVHSATASSCEVILTSTYSCLLEGLSIHFFLVGVLSSEFRFPLLISKPPCTVQISRPSSVWRPTLSE